MVDGVGGVPREVARKLAAKSKMGGGKISASVWNEYVKERGGNGNGNYHTINNYINLSDAINSINHYNQMDEVKTVAKFTPPDLAENSEIKPKEANSEVVDVAQNAPDNDAPINGGTLAEVVVTAKNPNNPEEIKHLGKTNYIDFNGENDNVVAVNAKAPKKQDIATLVEGQSFNTLANLEPRKDIKVDNETNLFAQNAPDNDAPLNGGTLAEVVVTAKNPNNPEEIKHLGKTNYIDFNGENDNVVAVNAKAPKKQDIATLVEGQSFNTLANLEPRKDIKIDDERNLFAQNDTPTEE